MKIDEFIEQVNKVAYAEYENVAIGIYSCYERSQMEDWFLFIDPFKQSLNDTPDWANVGSLGLEDLFYILGLVQELRKAPVKERFPERKYYLCVLPKKEALGWRGENAAIWVSHIGSFDDGFRIDYGPKTAFTEETLNDIKGSLPSIAPMIDAMKIPVEDVK